MNKIVTTIIALAVLLAALYVVVSKPWSISTSASEYSNPSYALAHKDNIVVFSVTYLGEEDQIREGFVEVLSSLTLN